MIRYNALHPLAQALAKQAKKKRIQTMTALARAIGVGQPTLTSVMSGGQPSNRTISLYRRFLGPQSLRVLPLRTTEIRLRALRHPVRKTKSINRSAGQARRGPRKVQPISRALERRPLNLPALSGTSGVLEGVRADLARALMKLDETRLQHDTAMHQAVASMRRLLLASDQLTSDPLVESIRQATPDERRRIGQFVESLEGPTGRTATSQVALRRKVRGRQTVRRQR